MTVQKSHTVHWSFWLIGVLALVWNVMGCVNFLVQIMNPELVVMYRDNERNIIQGRPLWATLAFAFAIFGGAVGCILLLLKRPPALYFFVISLLGVVLTLFHMFGTGLEFSAGELFGIAGLPLVVAAFLVWYAGYINRVRRAGK